MKISLLCLVFGLLISLQSVAGDFCRSPPALDHTETPYFADNGYGRMSSPWLFPGGQHYNGVTYFCYQGPAEGAYVSAYNHTSHSWTGPVKVLDNPMGGMNPELLPQYADNHGAPFMAITHDGFINIFGGGHGGCDEYIEGTIWRGGNPYATGCKYRKPFPNDPNHIGLLRHVRSLKPENIFDWETPHHDNLSPFASYGSTIQLANGEIYVHVRHGTHTADWTYQRSADGGRTFQDPVRIFKYEKVRRKTYIAWYVRCFAATWNATEKKEIIGCAAAHHHHETGELYEGFLGHGPDRRNIYYLEINTTNGNMYNAYGEKLNSPVTLNEADSHAIAYQSDSANGEYAEPLDGKFNVNGDPEILFHIYSRLGKSGRLTERIEYMAYDRTSGWSTPTLISDKGTTSARFVDQGREVADVVMQTTDQGLYYFVGSKSEVTLGYSWEVDGNKSLCWDGQISITNIRNSHEHSRFVVMYAAAERNDVQSKYYKNVYAFGDNGLVSRSANTSTGLWERCFNARSNDECFNNCPANEMLLKVEIATDANVDIAWFKVKQRDGGGPPRNILKETNFYNSSTHTYERCLSASMRHKFLILTREVHGDGDGRGYKLTWGGTVIVKRDFKTGKTVKRIN